MSRLIALLLVPLLFACDPKNPEPAKPGPDAGLVALDAGVDGGSDPDAGVGTDAGAEDGGLPTTCEGACANTTLFVRVDETELPMDRVQFGFTSPEKSASGRWELYLEAHAGGDPACPQQDSPTPDRTLVFANIGVPSTTTEQTKGDGLSLVLLDFKGDLTQAPVVRAGAISLVPVAANLCPECTVDGGAPEDQFFAFDLTAGFETTDGGVTGHGYARYCESMNDL